MRAVIFDRDGVIIDSEFVNLRSAVYAFKKLGIKFDDEDKDIITARHPEDYKDYLIKKYSLSYSRYYQLIIEKYLDLIIHAPTIEETIKLVYKLYKKKIPLALTTSSEIAITLLILKRIGLENIFNAIVTFEDTAKRKPDPEPFLITAKKLKIQPKDCIVIEDSQIGVEAAKRAGMKCVAIPNKYTKKQNFSKADLMVDSAEKLSVEILNGL